MEFSQKYCRVERERRFLLNHLPPGVTQARHITDRYLDGTRLRLRELIARDRPPVFKLTQKVSQPGPAAQQGFITTLYLSREEFEILCQLPAHYLQKTRYSLPPFGIDVFEGELSGLILAEAEFESPSEADALTIPSILLQEVSIDLRFTGGRLASGRRQDVQSWLAEYGIQDFHRPQSPLY